MIFALDIEGKTNRIIGELGHDLAPNKLLKKIPMVGALQYYFVKRRIKRIAGDTKKHIDDYVLSLEGFQGHIAELGVEHASQGLQAIRESIRNFDKFDDNLAELNYLQDSDLKIKLKYTLKTLYKTEALLHKVVTKNAEPIKTPTYLKEGLATMSQAAIKKSL